MSFVIPFFTNAIFAMEVFFCPLEFWAAGIFCVMSLYIDARAIKIYKEPLNLPYSPEADKLVLESNVHDKESLPNLDTRLQFMIKSMRPSKEDKEKANADKAFPKV